MTAATVLPLLSCSKQSANSTDGEAKEVDANGASIEEIAAGIEKHIAAQSQANGGYFNINYQDEELNLELVRIHMEYLSDLGGGVSFACVDLVDTGGTVYDVDFFMTGPPGNMRVVETTVHKLDGKPLYTWAQKQDKTWHKVPVAEADERLLGVINGRDEFEFIYRAQLPEITGAARLWIPLAISDHSQRIEVTHIDAPGAPRELDESGHGNKVLFLEPEPSDSGRMIEIHYRVERTEKESYPAATGENPQDALKPERLVPADAIFASTAREVTAGKVGDMVRARALYDHVIDGVRYAKYGSGWGAGDALYACDARNGNCTDFHSYFIALARAVDIPARFAIGASIPSQRNDGGIDGYHCWAEFYADGKWVPVDISEGNKNERMADYYFGHHPANRIELSKGRDLVVDPAPVSGPINFLAYPLLEIDGNPIKVRTEFLFQREVVQ